MKYDPANPKYDDLMWAVGNLAVWFNVLESHVRAETWTALTNSPKMGRVVTARLGFAQVVDLLADAYLLLIDDPKGKEEVKRLRRDLMAAAQKRNDVVHSVWAPAGLEGEPKVAKGKGRNRGAWDNNWSVDDLPARIVEVHMAIQEIRHLSIRVIDVVKMLPAKRGAHTP